MNRPAAILLAGIVVGAGRLPLPPTPPAHVPPGGVARAAQPSLRLTVQRPALGKVEPGEPAPLPDSDLEPPASGPATEKFNIRIFSLDEHGGGMGFIPGSAYQAPEARKPMQTPEVTLSVPLQ